MSASSIWAAEITGVGARPIDGAKVTYDGSRKMLDDKLAEKAKVTIYFNAEKVHENVVINGLGRKGLHRETRRPQSPV